MAPGVAIGSHFLQRRDIHLALINVSLVIWPHRLSDDGIGVPATTNCETVASYNTWIHTGVNAMSTLLLGGSNYSMQCLFAPSRNEVQKADSKGIWLDIGVSSARNLRRIAGHRILVWGLLVLSSIPLHLMSYIIPFCSCEINPSNIPPKVQFRFVYVAIVK